MERALGIGGIFFRAQDPVALARWYRDALGIDVNSSEQDAVWRPEGGPTVFAPFPADTNYFGRPDQAWMLNLRVRDLDAMRDQLRAIGAPVAEETQVLEGIGRFGWVADPEGNRIELWEPAPEALEAR
jgi:predicted enzyme related to lactoylglutathione lyase